ncbi:hypothetical protein ABK040_000641 [Willaertia magna]
MGSACSVADSTNLSNGESPTNGQKEAQDSFEQMLASMPNVYTDLSIPKFNSIFYVSCNPNAPTEELLITASDIKTKLFERAISRKELSELKTNLEQKMGSSVKWGMFFSAIRDAYYKKSVTLAFEDSDQTSCKINIDLIVKSYKTEIKLKLKQRDDYWSKLFSLHVMPLYNFYHTRDTQNTSEKAVVHKDMELKMLKEKYEQLEQKKAQLMYNSKKLAPKANVATNKVAPVQVTTNKSVPTTNTRINTTGPILTIKKEDPKTKRKDCLSMPVLPVAKFLIEKKKKIIKGKNMSDKEYDVVYESFNCVLNAINLDYAFKIGNNRTTKQYNKEVVEYLKEKFTSSGTDKNTSGQVDKKQFEETVANSPIDKSNMKQTIIELFDKVDKWNYDVFKINEVVNEPLFTTAFTLFLKNDLIHKFNIGEQNLINFLRNIEAGYHNNPYHNAAHAADVLQSLHYIIHKGGLHQYLSDEDLLAATVAAIIHDFDHPGVNNSFEINAQTYLSILYNDRSVLENHHIAEAFELMRNKDLNILQSLSEEQYKDVRETVIQMVLSTDLSNHGAIMARFKTKVEKENESHEVDISAKDDVRLALQMAIKVSDASNPARPQQLYLKWAQLFDEEIRNQGSVEKELSLSVSPFMSGNTSVADLQTSYINFIASPTIKLFCKLLPRMKFVLEHLQANETYWKTHSHVDPKDIEE